MVWTCLHVCIVLFVLFVSLFVKGCVDEWMDGWWCSRQESRLADCKNASPQSPSQSFLRVTTHCHQRLLLLSVFRNKLCRVGANQTASSTRAASRPYPSFFSSFSLDKEGGRGGELAHIVDERETQSRGARERRLMGMHVINEDGWREETEGGKE